MKTIEEPLNENKTVNAPDEGAIPDSDAEAAAGGFNFSLSHKVYYHCETEGCSQYHKNSLFKIDDNPVCYKCRQPLKRGSVY